MSVVVDDHDMGITHVIRGDDHLTNTFRQLQIYQAMGWTPPSFAHIPLIHGPDGAKLSKRHGALGVEAYRDMGYLPEALRNYLLRLGWGHGDDEIISTEQAIQWFDLDAVGRGPSRFDFAKLDNLNGHYLRQTDDARLAQDVAQRLGVAGDAAIEQRAGCRHGRPEGARQDAEGTGRQRKVLHAEAAADPGRQGPRPVDGRWLKGAEGIAGAVGGRADLDRRRPGGRWHAPSRKQRASSSARSPSRCARPSPARPPRRRFSR